MPDKEFELLFKVQEAGNGTSDLNAKLKELYKQGFSAAEAMKKLGASFDVAAAAAANGAKNVNNANASMQQAFAQTARVKTRADAEMQRSANAAFQTNMRIWQQQQAEAKRASDEEQRSANAAFQTNMRIWKAEEIERKRIAAQRLADVKRQEAAQEAANLRGTRGAASILGIGGAMAIGTSAFGVMAGAGAAVGFADMLRNAAQGAQELHNLADEFGISTQRAFQFQAAARLVGVDIGTLSQGARHLSDALSDPGGAGKKTAEELVKAGVDIRGSLGEVLDSIIDKLQHQKTRWDENSLAAKIFGRQGIQFVPVVNALDQVNQKIETMTEERLVAANRSIQDLGNSLSILAGKASSSFLAISGYIQTGTAAPIAILQQMLGIGGSKGGEFKPTVGPNPPAGNWDALLKSRTANPDKHDVTQKIEELRKQLSEQEMFSDNDRRQGRSDTVRQADQKKESDLRAEIRKLEDSQKKDPRLAAIRREDEVMAELQNRQLLHTNIGIFRPLGEAQVQFQDRISRINSNPDYTAADRDRYRKAAMVLYGQDVHYAYEDIHQKQAEATGKFGDYTSEAFSKSGRGNQRDLMLDMRESIQDFEKQQRENRESRRIDIQGQAGAINRGFAYRSAIRNATGNESIGQDYTDAIRQAQDLYQMRLKEIQLDTDETQQQMDRKKALYEFISQQDEAQMRRNEEIARVGQQQSQEAGNFFKGWFSAAISGQPGASSNYMRSYGQNIVGNMVGNAASAMLPNGFNQFTSMGKGGALGTPDDRSFLGKLVKGTPLDFSAEEMKKFSDAHNPLVTSQDALKNSVDALNITMGGRPPTSSGMTGISSVMSGVNSGNPFSVLAGIASATNGGSAGGVARMLGPGGTAGFFPGPISGANVGPLDMSSFYNSVVNSGSIDGGVGYVPNSSLSTSSIGGSAPGDGMSYGNTARMPGWTPGLGDIPNVGIGAKIAGGANSLAGLIGGTGRMLGSGNALQGIFTGGIDYGDGTGAALGTGQRIAGAAGLAGATYAGVSSAVRDFSKGGGRGIVGGIGASLGTAAMFDPDPISRMALGAGSAIMGLVKSLFPDPRAQRIKQEQKRLINSAYLQPAARDYNFAGSEGSGFSMGMGGSLRAGGQAANYTFNLPAIHALDANSFVNWMKSNPNAAGQAMMSGLTDSGISAISSQISFNASTGGFVPPGGLLG